MPKIKRALISVSDKQGLVDFAKSLVNMGVEIISTGGTAKALREADLAVTDVSEYTGFPEMMDGRLKTLHPKIHGALLARRDNPNDMKEIAEQGIVPIDMVVVNLYPFEKIIAKPGVTYNDAIENIDIGGPTMLRSAAKNSASVAVVVDPGDYSHILEEMISLRGDLSYKTRTRLARKVFRHTSRYDTIIGEYLCDIAEDNEGFPDDFTLTFSLGSELRYGENPHQDAAVYFQRSSGGLNLKDAQKLQGLEMSYNNYYDTHSALMLCREFKRKTCVIVKHNNPCGCAVGETPLEAYMKASVTDPVSAFGGVLAFNAEVDAETATAILKYFVEVVLAPGFTPEALAVFEGKPKTRVLRMPEMHKPLAGYDIKRIAGGLLFQDWDMASVDISRLKAVTKRQPTAEELEGLSFAWRVSKHVKTNAVVYTLSDRTVGIGMGQASRVASAKIGAINALEPLRGSVVASDGFFPFRDAIDAIYKVGVTAVIQPGGSINDQEVIKAADERDMAMLLTGIRHFNH